MIDAAHQLAELGYAVFPCAPGQKRPLCANGLLDATTDAEQIEAWWEQSPEANVAIRTDGLLVLDFDTIDGQPNPWLKDQPDRYLELAAAPCSITPRGGRHYFFRQPSGRTFRNTASRIAPKVDTRADGGYVLVWPSVVDGKGYAWNGGELLAVPPMALPEPPGWLLKLLDDQVRVSVRTEQRDGNLIADGQRNQTLTSLAGTMRRVGMGEQEILAALRATNATRCNPPLADDEIKTIAWSCSRYEPDSVATALVEHGTEAEQPATHDPRDPGKFPESLLAVPGFLGEVIDYNLAGAIKEQPVLALGAAIALLGTLTGRKVADAFGTRTNVYCLGVCESGGGKERARQVNKEILYLAGLEKLIGNEGFASHAGIISAVERQPAILFQLDEIGRLLKTLGNASHSPHLYHIATVLMKLFTSSNSVYIGDAYADADRNKKIFQPHACVYGTTVPRSLYEGLSTESLTDGFLSRILLFQSDNPDPEPRLIELPASPPDRLLEAARYWGDLRPGGNLSEQTPQPIVVSYTPEANEAMAALEARSRSERLGSAGDIATMWTRTTEKARKLALLHACSANHIAPEVDLAAAEWAASLSEFVTRKMLAMAFEWVAENSFESTRKRVLRTIRERSRGISASELTRKTRWLKTKERDEILGELMLAREIDLQELKDTNGRPKRFYVAL